MRRDSSLTPDDEGQSGARSASAGRPRARVSEADARELGLDARLLELEEEEPAFLRAQKRIPVRRGPLPRKTANRLKFLALALAALALAGCVLLALYRYGAHSWRFQVESSDQVDIEGIHKVSRSQVLEIMGGDIGRNIFFVPLAERKQQLEQIPWVESATVMRPLPNRLKIEIRERAPVAFVQVGSKIELIDGGGVVMDLPAGGLRQFSFPVIVGMGEPEPLSTRAARMKIYLELVRELDSTGAHYSQDLSEVDLSDPEDIKVTTADPGGEVLVHLGAGDFLSRYQVFVSHLQEWRTQYEHLHSVDLRYERQVILNPDDKRPDPRSPAARVMRARRQAARSGGR